MRVVMESTSDRYRSIERATMNGLRPACLSSAAAGARGDATKEQSRHMKNSKFEIRNPKSEKRN